MLRVRKILCLGLKKIELFFQKDSIWEKEIRPGPVMLEKQRRLVLAESVCCDKKCRSKPIVSM